ncbi:F0F1 ATP synthase subunit A [Spirochaeta cellobiosiphila]|uniref:F0F1 ATP synthase subunit A n=1 Tax=Spirochaeta cellobiosiphila TaxID=504483 RepID=UPI000401EE53|nr:F0F1 ATP synthase subunit A [Spirochaeta cellobiosiphila]
MIAKLKGYHKLPLLFLMMLMGSSLFAQEQGEGVSETLFKHILDGHEWDIFPFLPTIHLPNNLSVHQLMLIIGVFLASLFFLLLAKKNDMKPKKLTLTMEYLVLFVRDDMVYPIMGEEKGKKWLPFFITLFVYLLILNILGLIPAFKTATGNINVAMMMAIPILFITFIDGIRHLGIKKFFTNLYPEGSPFAVGIFVAVLEFISIFTRSLVLGLRLFANMFAGHMAILSFLVLIFVINPFFGFISVPFAVFTYTLEVLIAVLQAFVFTLLSCIFIAMASEH